MSRDRRSQANGGRLPLSGTSSISGAGTSGFTCAPLGIRPRPLLDLLGLIRVQDLPERLSTDPEPLCRLGWPDRLTEAPGEFASSCGDSGDGRSVLRGLAGKAQQLLDYLVHLLVVRDSMLWVKGLMTTSTPARLICPNPPGRDRRDRGTTAQGAARPRGPSSKRCAARIRCARAPRLRTVG